MYILRPHPSFWPRPLKTILYALYKSILQFSVFRVEVGVLQLLVEVHCCLEFGSQAGGFSRSGCPLLLRPLQQLGVRQREVLHNAGEVWPLRGSTVPAGGGGAAAGREVLGRWGHSPALDHEGVDGSRAAGGRGETHPTV